jgi:allantoin racemase
MDGDNMGVRIWHQSFTVLENLPAYAAALDAHFKSVARPDTEVVLHGMHRDTYQTDYPGSDIRYAYLQSLHAQQFVWRGIQAEEAGFDVYAILSLCDPMMAETRAVIDIPVVGYGESSMLAATMLGEKFGVLMFIPELLIQFTRKVEAAGLALRYAGGRHVGFAFSDVQQAFSDPGPVIEKFHEAARALIRDGAEVIIPGEAPMCVLLARNGINRIDGVPVLDGLAAAIKSAESMVDLRRSSGLAVARTGHYSEKPPRERVKEMLNFYFGQRALS